MLFKEVHKQKHAGPKDVTDDGIVTFVKEVFTKQPCPKVVTDGGIVIFVKEVQERKHSSPNAVTKYKH